MTKTKTQGTKKKPRMQRVSESICEFQSMEQLSAVTGIPVKIVRQAKAGGCTAFIHGRVLLGPLLRFLFSTDQTTDWGDELRRWQAERAKIKARMETGELVQVKTVAQSLLKCGMAQKTILRQRLENEYPAFVAQLQPAEARVFGKRLADEILKEFSALAGQWNGKHEGEQ